MPTNQTWLDLGLADPPTIDGYNAPSKPTPTTPIVVVGHGDAGDTITLYDNGTAIAGGTGTVAADGTWSITIFLPVGYSHDITATQTVNQLPEVGLTSGAELRRRHHGLSGSAGHHLHLDARPDDELDSGHCQRHRRRRRHDHALRRLAQHRLGDRRRRPHLDAHRQPRRRHAHADATQTTPGGGWGYPPQLTSDASDTGKRDGLRAAAGADDQRAGRLARRAHDQRLRRRRRHGHRLRGDDRDRHGARRVERRLDADRHPGPRQAHAVREADEPRLRLHRQRELEREHDDLRAARAAGDHRDHDAGADEDDDAGDGLGHRSRRLRDHALRRRDAGRHGDGCVERQVVADGQPRRRRPLADGDADSRPPA